MPTCFKSVRKHCHRVEQVEAFKHLSRVEHLLLLYTALWLLQKKHDTFTFESILGKIYIQICQTSTQDCTVAWASAHPVNLPQRENCTSLAALQTQLKEPYLVFQFENKHCAKRATLRKKLNWGEHALYFPCSATLKRKANCRNSSGNLHVTVEVYFWRYVPTVRLFPPLEEPAKWNKNDATTQPHCY